MTGTSNAYSSVLRNVANIATITLSLITIHVRTILHVKTLKHQSPRVKRHRNIGNGGQGGIVEPPTKLSPSLNKVSAAR